MVSWISNKIIHYFKNKAISKINSNSEKDDILYFKKQIDFLNKKYNNLEEIYWIGSYQYDERIIDYFKEKIIVSINTFNDIPIRISSKDINIIDVIMGRTLNNEWFISFFSDQLNLYKEVHLLDTFKLQVDDNFQLKNIYTPLK